MINVKKRDGSLEQLDPKKYTKVCEWACDGIAGVSASDLAFDTYDKMYDGISTRDLHESVIETAVNKITTKTPNYDKVAARLVIFQIRKEVYGQYTPPRLYEIVQKNVENGYYTRELLDWYSEEDFDRMDSIIKHERDNEFTYAATEQLRSKYLVQNRADKSLHESPQVTYMLIAATLFHSEDKSVRLDVIKDYYESQSTFMFSIPTPIAAGVRTPTKQFSSCCLIPVDDSLDSICAAGTSIVKYVSQKAGIGLDLGRIRAIGSKVKDGSVSHTGVLPFIKKFKGDLKSCSQGGVRGAAATVYYPWWHYEFPELVVLKNNSGTEESRERHLDYNVQIDNFLIQKFIADENVTLFSPQDVPLLQEAFYRSDKDEFAKQYAIAQKNPLIRKREVSAREVIHNLVNERQKTGRIYITFMENFVLQSPFTQFKEKQWLSSNLCVHGETIIDTLELGEVEIQDAVDQCLSIWNGYKWSKVDIVKTGENQELIRVVVEDIISGDVKGLTCTMYHKWYLSNGECVRTFQLNKGDTLLSWVTSGGDRVCHKVMYLLGACKADTYCYTEKEVGRGVFNGILTGQCVEIALPIKSFESLNDPEGQIALCTLSSANWGKLSKPTDLEKPCRSMVRALDNLLSYQDYPVEAARRFTEDFRALGVGVVGFAHFLAKRGLKYDILAAEVVDEYAEAMAYYLIDESVRLAEQRGKCKAFAQTCYADGVFPWERRNPNVDKLVKHKLRYNWEELRSRLKLFGIRNATLMAIAPTESSSILLGETNGIEAPLADIVEKKSKDGSLKQVVPEHHHLRNKYDYRWGQKDNKGYLVLMAVLQKWIDQSISSNTNYDPTKFEDNKVPMSTLVQDLIFANEIGIKTLYYHNTNDSIADESETLIVDVEEVCDTCVI